jgi:hypothetical protein
MKEVNQQLGAGLSARRIILEVHLTWKQKANEPRYIDLARQQDAYELLTGDRPTFFGFDGRFAEWCAKHPRESLKPA